MSLRISLLFGVSVSAAMYLPAHLQAQPPPTVASFEAASVKPAASADTGASFGLRPGGLIVIRNNTLRNMVRNAYQVQNFQIVGGPDWFDRDRFDVNAKTTDPNAPPLHILDAVKSLLAERFALAVHRETREVPIYVLVAERSDGRLGPRITLAGGDCAAIKEALRRGATPQPPQGTSPDCGTRISPGHLRGRGVSLDDLVRNLSTFAGRLIVDRSGRTDFFDVDLDWTPDQSALDGRPAAPPAAAGDAPDLFTAVQEQLGLKLNAERGPAEVLVVDHADRPAAD